MNEADGDNIEWVKNGKYVLSSLERIEENQKELAKKLDDFERDHAIEFQRYKEDNGKKIDELIAFKWKWIGIVTTLTFVIEGTVFLLVTLLTGKH